MNKFLVVTLVLLLSSPLYAGELSFSIYGGKDFYRIEYMKRGFNLIDLTEASINRTGFENPWLLGVDFGFCIGNGFSLDFAAEGVYLKYDVNYTVSFPFPNDPLNKKTSYYDVEWARFALFLTLRKTIISTKYFQLYGGLGGGLHLIAPVVSDRFLMMTLKDKFDEFDPSTDVSLSNKFGGNANMGIRIIPFAIPLKFKAEAKYTMMQKGDYEEPDSFFSVLFGIIYNFKL
jgi:hypothetical protein